MRLIFGWFLEGLTTYAIAKELTRRGILTVMGQSKWNQATINSFLRNEVRQDDTNLENIHAGLPREEGSEEHRASPQLLRGAEPPAIIAPETFEMVQAEVARRKREGGRYSGVSIFSGKIKCGECGGSFGAKVWYSTDKYRRVIYRCNKKYDGHKCQTPHVIEEEIKTAFVTAFNTLVTEREEIAANARLVRQTLCDTVELEREKAALGQELAVLVEMTQNCIAENARVAQDQVEYQKCYNGLVERYDKAKTRFDEVTETIAQRSAKGERLAGFIRTLEAQEGPCGGVR